MQKKTIFVILTSLTILLAACDIIGEGLFTKAQIPILENDGELVGGAWFIDQAIELSVSATAPDGGVLTYQWYKAANSGAGNTTGEPIEGATGAAFSCELPVAGTYYFYVVVTNTKNGKTAAITSGIAKVTMTRGDAASPEIIHQPASASYTWNAEMAISALAVTANVSEASGTLSYQWYSNTTESNSDGTQILGATESTYQPDIAPPFAPLGNTWYYYVVVKNTDEQASGNKETTLASDVAAITVNISAQAAAPTMTIQPASATYPLNATVVALTAAATASDGGTLSYQWHSNTLASTMGGLAIPGAIYTIYTPTISTAAEAKFYYYVVITNTNTYATNTSNTTTSNVATVRVKDEFILPNVTLPDYAALKAELQLIVDQMTLDEKVGQMTQAEQSKLSNTTDVKTYFLGSILSGGGSGPGGPNASQSQWFSFTNSTLMSQSLGTRLRIPYMFATDAKHGHANAIVNSTVFPHNVGIGAIAVGDLAKGQEAAYKEGQVTRNELIASGIRWNLFPMVEASEFIHWGRTYECYSEKLDIVKAMGKAYITGIQEEDPRWSGIRVGACAQGYIGTGHYLRSPTQSSSNLSLNEEGIQSLLPPYQEAVNAGCLSVMASFISVNGTKCVYNQDLITTKLKGQLGFQGFVVSDWNDIPSSGTNLSRAINAGMDMAMQANNVTDWRNFITNLKAAVNNGTVPMSRIDDAVLRILLFKKVMGIMDTPTIPNGSGAFYTPEHQQIARDIAAETLVLLKNTDDIVGRLNAFSNILVTGEASAHMGMQCGGWTITLQGSTSATVTGLSGKNIWEGIQEVAVGKNLRRNETGLAVSDFTPDVVIAVVSEVSYAENMGDSPFVNIRSTDATMLTNVQDNYRSQGIPVVVVIMSGRPLYVTAAQLNNMDGFVAAWLPGNQGGLAIADVLFGYKDFVGKTPYTWKVSSNGAVTFPYGWGLRKGETATP